ncbi:MAG: tetratricopeptide repeat protein, partial [Acidobacteria bacterium]|nr:tetratricopeptide repeat protein [Acidobacteriota bacterium]
YELLTGVSPYKAETPMDSMIMRTHTLPVPPVNVAPDVPSELNAIAVGCLQIQPENRIQTATELAIWLDEFLHPSGTSTQLVATGVRTMAYSTTLSPVTPTMAMDAAPTVTTMMPVAAPPALSRRKWFLAAGGAVLAAGAGYGVFRYTQPAATTLKPGAPVTVLVADFVNNTGDSNLDGTIEPLLSLALEESAVVNIFSRRDAIRELAAVNAGADRIVGATAQLLARRLGVGLIIDGTIEGSEGKFEVKVRAVDPNGTVLKETVATASKRDQLLTAVPKLAPELRQVFGDATPGSSAETYTTTSLEAAHAYARAQDLGFRGRFQESLVEYQRTISLDPSMGRAYAGMATVNRNSGQLAAAEDNFKQALSRIDRMTEREQYRTRGSYAITVENYRKAVEEYTQLVKKFPADNTGHGNLAVALLQIRDVDRALVEGREATRINPSSLSQQNNVAYYLLYAGNFDGALRQAKLVTDKDPGYLKAHMVAALANLALGNVDAARASFERAGPSGVLGLADIDFLEGSFQAVVNRLASSKSEAEQIVAAQAMLRLGDRRGAAALAEQVATTGKSLGALYQAALTLQAAGVPARARTIARQLGTRLGEGPQMYSNLIESDVALAGGQTQEAVRFASDAQKMVDTWLGRYHLGRAYLQAKGYAEAQSEFDHCVRRSGEATGVFIDDLPTWRLMAPAYFYLAQAEEGLGSAGAKTNYQKFLNLAKNLSPTDPMAVQARKGSR